MDKETIRQTCWKCGDKLCGNNPYRDPGIVPRRSIHGCLAFGKLRDIQKKKGEHK